jgi:hypothetical protein
MTVNRLLHNRYRTEGAFGFLAMWEFYVGYAIFYLLVVHLPWGWLAETGLFDGFVTVMASLVPAIEGLPDDFRNRPRAASELQLSFIHFAGMTFVTLKLIFQRPNHNFERLSTWRLFIGLLGCLILLLFWCMYIFFWGGHIPE